MRNCNQQQDGKIVGGGAGFHSAAGVSARYEATLGVSSAILAAASGAEGSTGVGPAWRLPGGGAAAGAGSSSGVLSTEASREAAPAVLSEPDEEAPEGSAAPPPPSGSFRFFPPAAVQLRRIDTS